MKLPEIAEEAGLMISPDVSIEDVEEEMLSNGGICTEAGMPCPCPAIEEIQQSDEPMCCPAAVLCNAMFVDSLQSKPMDEMVSDHAMDEIRREPGVFRFKRGMRHGKHPGEDTGRGMRHHGVEDMPDGPGPKEMRSGGPEIGGMGPGGRHHDGPMMDGPGDMGDTGEEEFYQFKPKGHHGGMKHARRGPGMEDRRDRGRGRDRDEFDRGPMKMDDRTDEEILADKASKFHELWAEVAALVEAEDYIGALNRIKKAMEHESCSLCLTMLMAEANRIAALDGVCSLPSKDACAKEKEAFNERFQARLSELNAVADEIGNFDDNTRPVSAFHTCMSSTVLDEDQKSQLEIFIDGKRHAAEMGIKSKLCGREPMEFEDALQAMIDKHPDWLDPDMVEEEVLEEDVDGPA